MSSTRTPSIVKEIPLIVDEDDDEDDDDVFGSL